MLPLTVLVEGKATLAGKTDSPAPIRGAPGVLLLDPSGF
jgi:hypothetical protein